MKKHIGVLEQELAQMKVKLEYKEKEIQVRKQKIIRVEGKDKESNNRRKTWAPTHIKEETIEINGIESVQSARPRSDMNFEEYGHQVEYSDEQFNNVMNCSFGVSSVDRLGEGDADNGAVGGERPNVRNGSTSLLRTPKVLRHTRKSLQNQHLMSPLVAQPIDKDKRISDLENEIEELQQFYKIEAVAQLEAK